MLFWGVIKGKTIRNFFVLFVLILILALQPACFVLPKPTATATATVTPSPSATTTPTITPSPTPRPTITPTATTEPTKDRSHDDGDYDYSSLPGYFAFSDFDCPGAEIFCMNISLVSPDLKQHKRLTNHQDGLVYMMRWSPDNRYIVYAAYVMVLPINEQIRLYDFKTQKTVTLASNLECRTSSISWSPDSRQVALGFDNGQIKIINIATQAITQMQNISKASHVKVTWSPDGKTIAYSNDFGIEHGLYTIPAGGGKPTLQDPQGFLPAWSPDGLQIAYYRERNDGNIELVANEFDINQAAGQGTVITTIVKEARYFIPPVWSPDGRFIASFAGVDEETVNSGVIRVDDHQIFQAKKGVNSYREPSWSPDSRGLVFMDSNGVLYLAIFDLEGPNFSVDSKTAYSDVAWSPTEDLP